MVAGVADNSGCESWLKSQRGRLITAGADCSLEENKYINNYDSSNATIDENHNNDTVKRGFSDFLSPQSKMIHVSLLKCSLVNPTVYAINTFFICNMKKSYLLQNQDQ